MMGMGAMYAACNLGGFFDGTASGSLHGLGLDDSMMALAGSTDRHGVRLRNTAVRALIHDGRPQGDID